MLYILGTHTQTHSKDYLQNSTKQVGMVLNQDKIFHKCCKSSRTLSAAQTIKRFYWDVRSHLHICVGFMGNGTQKAGAKRLNAFFIIIIS